MNYWVDYDYRFERPQQRSAEEMKNRFFLWVQQCNRSKDPFADSIAYGIFDEKRFQTLFFKNFDVNNHKKSFEAYIHALYYSLHNKSIPEKIRVLEKSVEHAEFAQDLHQFYPKAKFIHILRNPYATIVSLRKYKSIHFGYPIIKRVMNTLSNHYYFLYRNRRSIKYYYLIKYEDLVKNPKKEMEALCRFIEIPFEPTLLIPTYQREAWQGNSMSGQKFKGIESTLLESWKNEIHPMEIEYINRLFPFVLEDYGYERIKLKNGFWKPQKGENLARYLANRFYKYFLQEWDSLINDPS